MAKTKEELKKVFVKGYTPTQEDFSNLIDGVQGPKGEPGVAGKDGAKGVQGAPGNDGFGTETQYNELVSRLVALEGKE